MGDQEFEGFDYPVLVAMVKMGSSPQMLATLLEQQDARLTGLLDSGLYQGERPFLVLEKLQPSPYERFGRRGVDPATALDIYINLLESLKGLHFRRSTPLVLCDIRPEGLMLRMPTEDGSIGDRAYLERLAKVRDPAQSPRKC